ncbi:hypothetical protein L484_026758 [Morus notabilis]|uniref:Uncharacterized protein n=1 Tax=Morus notabilis TaxID=981085 RepID=W9SKR4_9ROSA|nr:hypothetical protein L484_026758 [Morus notabilis]
MCLVFHSNVLLHPSVVVVQILSRPLIYSCEGGFGPVDKPELDWNKLFYEGDDNGPPPSPHQTHLRSSPISAMAAEHPLPTQVVAGALRSHRILSSLVGSRQTLLESSSSSHRTSPWLRVTNGINQPRPP